MKLIKVTIVYAFPDIQHIFQVNVCLGSTVKDAILSSKILKNIKNISLYKNKIGIYNKQVYLNTILKNEDRIEIYRPLIVTPNERRKKLFF
ncbi:RnfH family protein [Buchnera aphidicola (Muscaphis stroyani)]|uniref:UPF0125 protein D9V75_01225 n=1 Tax=Buchnera aphidicola (Muscaphis stroyani) TaxID=1241869 RepID=A0A4D6Y4I1_9GAMM|nr:RnfH family protein [Buchnera aphidicola]QCI24332.1 RnfH family protein [Buchnera aphidicola (Muscaphis stroyani)]